MQRASITAARSAAVVLPDHIGHYSDGSTTGDPPYTISIGNLNLEPYLEWAGFSSTTRFGLDNPPRLAVIRTAAVYPLIPLYLRNNSGSAPEVQSTLLNNHTAVVFPNTPGSNSLRRTFSPNELVHVRVTHGYACRIPLANKLVCRNRPHRFSGDFSYSGASVPEDDHIILSAESSFPLMDIGVLGDL